MASLAAQVKRQQAADMRVIASAVYWLTRYDPKTVCRLVWNKYGYFADIAQGGAVLTIGNHPGYDIKL